MTDTPPTPLADLAARNQRTGLVVMGVVLGMVLLSFASVPLYRLFCQVTGFGGPAAAATATVNPGIIRDRVVEIRFNADVDQDLPWSFTPEDRRVDLQVGAEGLTAYRARNDGPRPITGTAVYNVLPPKAGKYFHKTQCFCFGEQQLNPGQDVHMPVIFYLDPAFADDPEMADIESITLSYTFYQAESDALTQALRAYEQR
jgi:cytochrome c oxidase assembly protein subunit 11